MCWSAYVNTELNSKRMLFHSSLPPGWQHNHHLLNLYHFAQIKAGRSEIELEENRLKLRLNIIICIIGLSISYPISSTGDHHNIVGQDQAVCMSPNYLQCCLQPTGDCTGTDTHPSLLSKVTRGVLEPTLWDRGQKSGPGRSQLIGAWNNVNWVEFCWVT